MAASGRRAIAGSSSDSAAARRSLLPGSWRGRQTVGRCAASARSAASVALAEAGSVVTPSAAPSSICCSV
jgi:hypothetical protein